jgi:hypothetical protein
MNLSDFVSETLVEVQKGVQNAIRRCSDLETNGVINPVWGDAEDASRSDIREVTFDIALTTVDKSTGGITGGIRVMGIGVGGESKANAERSHVSRIHFSIPIVPPVTTVERPHTEPLRM